MDRRRAVAKALSMKCAAIESILEQNVQGMQKEKTLAFINISHATLVEQIQNGKYKSWKRK